MPDYEYIPTYATLYKADDGFEVKGRGVDGGLKLIICMDGEPIVTTNVSIAYLPFIQSGRKERLGYCRRNGTDPRRVGTGPPI